MKGVHRTISSKSLLYIAGILLRNVLVNLRVVAVRCDSTHTDVYL
jgi:hypothetical protein